MATRHGRRLVRGVEPSGKAVGGFLKEGRGAASIQPENRSRPICDNQVPAHRLHKASQPGDRVGSGSKHVGK
jgi:hypothetical protein